MCEKPQMIMFQNMYSNHETNRLTTGHPPKRVDTFTFQPVMFVGNSKQLFFDPAWKAQSKLPIGPKCLCRSHIVAYGRGSHTADATVVWPMQPRRLVYGRGSHITCLHCPLRRHRRRLPKDPRRRLLHLRRFPLRLPPAHPLFAWLWLLP